MKRTLITVVVMAVFLIAGSGAMAADDLVKSVQDGCKAEMEEYCAMVTPGEGRVLACLFAYQD